jgi:hypothetical protein
VSNYRSFVLLQYYLTAGSCSKLLQAEASRKFVWKKDPAMNGRISWFGVFMRLIGAIALVLLNYNTTGYFFYHWALRDFAAITALKAFAGALLLVGWIVCIRMAFVSLALLGCY